MTVGAGGAVKVNWSAGLVALEVPPAAVTVTSTVAADSAGEVTVIEVVELTTTPVPATVPNFTPVTPVKPVPVIVTVVPPAVDPVLGLTPVTVGAGGAVKVNWSAGALAARCPRPAVTVTSTVAADSAGEVTVIEVAELTTTPVPATVPNFTPVAPVKPVPVMVTGVPPAVEPGGGAEAGDGGGGRGGEGELVGGAGGRSVPPAAVTVTSTVPADSAGEVTVIEVVELTTTPVPATVPNFTPVTPVKPVPVMVTRGAPGRRPRWWG